MKRTLVVCFFVMFMFSLASAQDWIRGNLENAQSQSKIQNKPLLLYFHQEGG